MQENSGQDKSLGQVAVGDLCASDGALPSWTPEQGAAIARYFRIDSGELQRRVMRGDEDDRLAEMIDAFDAYFAVCHARFGRVPTATWETYQAVKCRNTFVKRGSPGGGKEMTDVELFDSRPARTETCPRCRGCGSVDVEYALHPWDDSLGPIDGAPEGAVRAFVAGSFDVFYAAREAAELAARAERPVAFRCIDHTVVVRPDDDPDQVARAWWLLQHGEAPEATWARR